MAIIFGWTVAGVGLKGAAYQPKSLAWDGRPEEIYWVEITDRADLGVDLLDSLS